LSDRHRRARLRRTAAGAVGDRTGQRARASGRASAGLRAGAGDDAADVRAPAHPGRCRAHRGTGRTRRRGGEGHHAGDGLAVLRIRVARQLFTALFVIYASTHFHVALDALQTALLPVLTLLSCGGSPSTTIAAVKFMSEWLGLPSDTVPLY